MKKVHYSPMIISFYNPNQALIKEPCSLALKWARAHWPLYINEAQIV